MDDTSKNTYCEISHIIISSDRISKSLGEQETQLASARNEEKKRFKKGKLFTKSNLV